MMIKKILVFIFIFGLFFCPQIFAERKELTKEEIIAVATERIKADGVSLEGVNIVYDDGNKLWEEQIDKIIVLDRVGNFGILKKGFLNNYKTVYFNFKAPVRDVWVFIDKDTGEVFDIYKA